MANRNMYDPYFQKGAVMFVFHETTEFESWISEFVNFDEKYREYIGLKKSMPTSHNRRFLGDNAYVSTNLLSSTSVYRYKFG